MLLLLLAVFVAVAAGLYASVGHGGASAYLAILAIAGLAGPEIAATVLLMNLVVSSIAFGRFYRLGHFDGRLALTFVAFSAPAAFVGGLLPVSPGVFAAVLGVALLVAGVRLALPELPAGIPLRERGGPVFWTTVAVLGLGLGLLAGVTGVGGGIYLSPLLLLLGWATVKTTAGVAAAFIFVNSATGLAGRLVAGQAVAVELLPLVGAALVGGWFGARWGAGRARGAVLRRMLSVVLFVAGAKLLLT